MDLISDLHIESWIEEEGHRGKIEKLVDNYYGRREGRVMIVAGDVSTNLEDTRVLMEILKERFDYVLYVYGNSEYGLYPVKGGDRYLSLEDKVRNIEVACGEGVTILEGDSIEIDGVSYYGTSGSIDPMHVYQVTGKGYEEFFEDRLEFIARHTGVDWSAQDHVKFFLEMYDKVMKRPKEVDVMITHYAPYFKGGVKELDNPTGYMHVPMDGIGTWVFGHVHQLVDREVDGTWYLNRCMGRSFEHKKHLILR